MIFRVIETELMPSLVGGDTETVCSKLKSGNRFLKPNFEILSNCSGRYSRFAQQSPIITLAIRYYRGSATNTGISRLVFAWYSS